MGKDKSCCFPWGAQGLLAEVILELRPKRVSVEGRFLGEGKQVQRPGYELLQVLMEQQGAWAISVQC